VSQGHRGGTDLPLPASKALEARRGRRRWLKPTG